MQNAWQTPAVLFQGVSFRIHPTRCGWHRLCEQINFTLRKPGCSFYFWEARLVRARYNTWDRLVVSVLACMEVVHQQRKEGDELRLSASGQCVQTLPFPV